eukprot:5089819-Pleurochrysis_carterae.AAC.1
MPHVSNSWLHTFACQAIPDSFIAAGIVQFRTSFLHSEAGVVPITGSRLQKAKRKYRDTGAAEMPHGKCSARETEGYEGGMQCETEA